MTERAKRIMEAYETSYTESGLVAALRELINQFDDWGGDEPSCCVFSELVSIIDELENYD
jgi:hypothetical protein